MSFHAIYTDYQGAQEHRDREIRRMEKELNDLKDEQYRSQMTLMLSLSLLTTQIRSRIGDFMNRGARGRALKAFLEEYHPYLRYDPAHTTGSPRDSMKQNPNWVCLPEGQFHSENSGLRLEINLMDDQTEGQIIEELDQILLRKGVELKNGLIKEEIDRLETSKRMVEHQIKQQLQFQKDVEAQILEMQQRIKANSSHGE